MRRVLVVGLALSALIADLAGGAAAFAQQAGLPAAVRGGGCADPGAVAAELIPPALRPAPGPGRPRRSKRRVVHDDSGVDSLAPGR